MNRIEEQFKLWSENLFFDEATRNELLAIKDQPQEIEERFYQNLQFGTGGLRGVLGAGTNRLNLYTITQATEAFAQYVDSLGEEAKSRGVCIAFDSRNYSPEFAERAALVFAAHGIHVYLFDSLRPTPVLSYAVRYYKAVGGVMVTASHNPAKYNGYKAYGEDGGQMPPEASKMITDTMETLTDFTKLSWMNREEAEAKGLLEIISPKLDDDYMKMLHSLSINPEMPKKHKDMKIVFTPLHGAGNLPVRRVLKEAGFENVYIVDAQEKPDGNFPTVAKPNPEERAALQMAIDLAEREAASLVIATDPDSDRAGCVVRLKDGSYQVLTGNQIGLLLMEYILGAKQKRGILPERSFCVTTIVSTQLVKAISEYYGTTLYTCLTGFKFIAELMKEKDEFGDEHFQFGFEESYGYLTGLEVRDKDAVVACMLICEMAATAKDEGKTLADLLQDLYDRYGYAAERTVSVESEGLEGIKKIQNALQTLRDQGSLTLESSPVLYVEDYLRGERKDLVTGLTETLTLPSSNVLRYGLEGLDWVCIRPSGTEPKLKIYCGCYDKDSEKAKAKLDAVSKEFEAKIYSLMS